MKNERGVKLAKRWGSYAMLALFLIACTALTTWTQSGGQADAASEKMVLLGNIQNTGGLRSAGNAGVTIYINKLGTQAEVNEIVEMLRTRGPQAVVQKLYSMDSGRFSPVGKVGTSLGLIRVFTKPTGERLIRALASRPETFREMYGMTRSDDYPFGVMEIQLDKDGKGQGVILVATKIYFDKDGMLQMESFDQAGQVRLINVRLQK